MFDTDTLIFIAEAMAINTKTHPDIDQIYESNRYAFLEYARKSDLYNHPFIVGGSVYHEEYGRKALGILQYIRETNDKSAAGSIYDIIQRGWPRAYNNITNYKKVNIEKYISELKIGCRQNAAEYTVEMFVFYCLCIWNNIPVIKPREIINYFFALFFRAQILSNDKQVDFYIKMEKDAQKEVDDLKDRILNDYGIVITPDNQIHIKNKELNKLYRFIIRLAFTEKIDPYYLFKEITLCDNDIKDVFGIYLSEKCKCSDDKAAGMFLSGIIIKLLAKSINQTKEHYFEYYNKNEKLYADIENHTENQKKTIDRLMAENKQISAENTRLKEAASRFPEKLISSNKEAEKLNLEKIRELEKTVAKQNEIIRQEREKERELAALRDFFFSLENQDFEPEAGPNTLLDLSGTTGAIIGGNPKCTARLRELLPKWVFISSEGFDKRSLDGLQTVCFFPNYISHALYYKSLSIAKNRNMDIGYIFSQNEHLAMKEIAKILVQARN